MGRNLNYNGYTMAWLAVLRIEAEAALGMPEKQQFASVRGDEYIHVGGETNGQKVVVATWPAGQNDGVGAAAALVNQGKAHFFNDFFALLVGVIASLPNPSSTDPIKLESILGLWSVLGVLGVCSASSIDAESSLFITISERQVNGNSGAAADLYGTGIRIGIYMQSIGMLMSLVSARQPKFKFAAATNTLAVLLSWSILAQRKLFSACEAWLILSIIGTFVFPGGAALCNIEDVAGEGIGIISIWVSILWLFSSIIWLFASLLHHLPMLGTSGEVWIFLSVRIDGWFRILMLSVGCALLVISLLTALRSTIFIKKAAYAWYAGENHADVAWTDDQREALTSFRYSQCIAGLLMWALAIVSSEKIIQWNGLSPEKDLSRPGQAIPLVIGILILMDGIGTLLKEPTRFTQLDTWAQLLKQVTLGSLKNAGRTIIYILLKVIRG